MIAKDQQMVVRGRDVYLAFLDGLCIHGVDGIDPSRAFENARQRARAGGWKMKRDEDRGADVPREITHDPR